MFNRRNIFHTAFRKRRLRAETRIRMPQPEFRPLRVSRPTVVRSEFVSPPEDWWFIQHRRGVKRTTVTGDPLEQRAVSKGQRKGTLPERIFLLELFKRGYREPADFCLAAHHRVLTADLQWVPGSELQPGDKLLAFDEAGSRSYCEAIVLRNALDWVDDTLAVTLSDGQTIMCTPEHPWLCLVDHRSRQPYAGQSEGGTQDWVPAKELRIGSLVPKFLSTWEANASKEAGYVAGFFDGEGSVIRPAKLERLDLSRLGKLHRTEVCRVVSVVPAGRQQIARLATTSKTFLAEGFGMHNTFQSSQEGGRQELGGIVADFLFHQRKIVIQVQGPFHRGVLRAAKDEEQDASLTEMGYLVLYIELEEIFSSAKLEAWFRRYMDPVATRGTGARIFWNPDGLDEADEAVLDDAWRVIARSSGFLQGSGIR